MVKNKGHKEFYFGKQSKFYGRHTKIGNVYSKWLGYMKVKGVYIITGTDSGNTHKTIWWFIKPNKNYTKIKIGFTRVLTDQIPTHRPGYYMKDTAARVSEVTAMLY